MKGMRRVGLVVLSLAVVLAGCAKAPKQTVGGAAAVPAANEPGSQTTSNGVTTIHLMDFGTAQITDALISTYQAKNPNVRIDLVRPIASKEKPMPTPVVTRELVAQGKVDVVLVTDSAGFAKDGTLMPLDPFIQKEGFDLKPYGSLVEPLRRGGKLYELPSGLQGWVLTYNRAMFKTAGETIPQEGWNWERFRSAAAKLTTNQGGKKVWGFASPMDEYIAQSYLEGRMGALSGTPSKADMEATMQFFSTLVLTDKSVAPSNPHDWGVMGFDMNNVEFEAGRAAMSIEDLSSLRFAKQNFANGKVDWGVAPVPTVDGKGTIINLNANTYGIAATTKQPEAAWQFLRFLTGPEGSAILAQYGQVPAYRTPDVQKAWFEQQPSPAPESAFLFTTDFKLPPQDGVITRGVWIAMNNAFNRVLSGKQPWEAAVDQYVQEVTQAGGKP